MVRRRLRMASWNLRFGRADDKLLERYPVDLLAAQEVTSEAFERFSRHFAWGFHGLDEEGSGGPRHAPAIFGSAAFTAVRRPPLEHLVVPWKLVVADVGFRDAGGFFAFASYHALNGVCGSDGLDKPRLSMQVGAWLEGEPGAVLLGMDANSPRVDHPDLSRVECHFPWLGPRAFERRLLGPEVRHQLRDVLRTWLEASPNQLRQIADRSPDGPLAVSHMTGRNPRRYDHVLATPDFRVLGVEYNLDEAQASGSDHAFVMVDLEVDVDGAFTPLPVASTAADPSHDEDDGEPPLLGRLAQTGWLSRHAEVLSTHSLAFLFEDSTLAQSWNDLLSRRLNIPLGTEVSWRAEALQADGGRPDLEATDTGGRPVVKVEAKLTAPMSTAQIVSYAEDLRRLGRSGAAGLALLVPTGRQAEAQAAIEAVLARSGSSADIAMAVLTWDEALHALEQTGHRAGDLRQLGGLLMTVGGLDARPLTPSDLRDWTSRQADFEAISSQVSQRLTVASERLLPMGREASGYLRRYVCPLGDDGSCFSIGLHDLPASSGGPIWMRYHRTTLHFAGIKERLVAHNKTFVEAEGHIWLPLNPPLGVGGEAVITALVAEAKDIHDVAIGDRS